jgi:hypothetical protein
LHIPAYYRPNANSPYRPVTEIDSNSFPHYPEHEGNITAVTFAAESQLKTIGGWNAFNATALTSIIIPASVTTIGQQAFRDCANLVTVTFAPNSQLQTIDQAAFMQCTELANITIPAGVTSIGNTAFQNCFSLTSITIPASVNAIGNRAFDQIANLISVTFEGTIPSSGFYDHSSNPSYATFPGDLRAKFYATDSANGTPGTYTRTSGSTTWTKS